MQRVLQLLLVVVMLVGMTGQHASSSAQPDDILDLADIPLPVQALPEAGYQVMAGAYLASDQIAAAIADPRNLQAESVQARLLDAPVFRAYVLTLVLPEDRAWQDSPPIALHQTSVYLVDDGSADAVVDLLLDHSNIANAEDATPATDDATTVHWVGESGEQLRTVVRNDNVILEIVSLDATGMPSATDHSLVVEGTLARLDEVRLERTPGLSTMALNLAPGDHVADFFNAQQSGVHGIYRLRDGNVQPAIGELGAEQMGFAPNILSIYHGNNLVEFPNSYASVSVVLTEFNSVTAAEGWYESLLSGSPQNQLVDPYYIIGEEETWTSQNVLGLYRLTGSINGEGYSGFVEIRQHGSVVAAIGYRSIGAALPDATTANNLMDHQLGCLDTQDVCPPYDFVIETATPQATPIVSDSSLGSAEFGWSLPELDSAWIVDEQFNESGYDRIGLRNGVSIFEFESVINHHGEPLQCVLDELHLLEEFEEHSVITVWEDAAGNTDGGNSSNQAWIVYRVEPLAEERADQEYVIRIDCFSLVPGSANLVMRHIAPIDYWEDEQPKGQMLRESIAFPESSESHGKLTASAHDRRTTMINFHWIDQAA